jgi:hypothetical protein
MMLICKWYDVKAVKIVGVEVIVEVELASKLLLMLDGDDWSI